MHRGKVDPGVSELPRDHVKRPLGGDMDFKIVDGFVMAFETGFTFVLVNVNGLGDRGGGGGGGAGALREPMDSNRSFPVISTLTINFAAFEIFRHMLDFKSNMFCLGLGQHTCGWAI